ncbi:hypothetical protein TorRG33x02_230290, partial [Trema orientale]
KCMAMQESSTATLPSAGAGPQQPNSRACYVAVQGSCVATLPSAVDVYQKAPL